MEVQFLDLVAVVINVRFGGHLDETFAPSDLVSAQGDANLWLGANPFLKEVQPGPCHTLEHFPHESSQVDVTVLISLRLLEYQYKYVLVQLLRLCFGDEAPEVYDDETDAAHHSLQL
jgi:hypothetical protein